MKRCLITGASGFIGGHLAEVLVSRGETVRCLVRKSSDRSVLERLGVEVCFGDVTDLDSLDEPVRDVDAVFHLAGLTSAHDVEHLYQVNRDGTLNLIRLLAELDKPPVLVHISSVAAAGPAQADRPRTTADEACPISNYGRSKRAGEIVLLDFADRVPISIVRPGIVFGPRNRETLPIFKTIRQLGVHPIAGLHPPALSLIHIDDLLEIMIRCRDRGKRISPDSSETGYYFACAPEHPDYAQWGGMMKRTLRRRWAPNLPIPFPIPWVIAAVSQFFARVTHRSTSFNIDKIREARAISWACRDDATLRDMNFIPNVSVEQRTRETMQWYLDAGWL